MSTEINLMTENENARKAALSRRLEGIGWGALLITIGTIWLVPEKQVPPGSWLMAVGIILLGLNAIRYFNALSMSAFTLIVGLLALLAGLGEFYGLDFPLFAIALIAVGVCLLLKRSPEKDSIPTAGHGWCCGWPGQHVNPRDAAAGQAAGH